MQQVHIVMRDIYKEVSEIYLWWMINNQSILEDQFWPNRIQKCQLCKEDIIMQLPITDQELISYQILWVPNKAKSIQSWKMLLNIALVPLLKNLDIIMRHIKISLGKIVLDTSITQQIPKLKELSQVIPCQNLTGFINQVVLQNFKEIYHANIQPWMEILHLFKDLKVVKWIWWG